MDAEKSSNSSFEDLSNLNEADIKAAVEAATKDATAADNDAAAATATKVEFPKEQDVIDILGNGQIVLKILQKSSSPTDQKPARGDLVTMDYVGRLTDGKIVENEKDAQVHVGDFEVVQGLDMSLPLISAGESVSLTVHPRFAYNSLGLKNAKTGEEIIPADATIIYEVHLKNIKIEDYADLKSFDIRRKYGNAKKERANFWYNRNEYSTAIQLYRRALEYLDNRDGDPDAAFDKEDIELSNSDLQTLLDDRLVVYNNLAMAQIKICAYDAALSSVENVLRCQPNNSKALYRKGRIMDAKGDTKSAITLMQKAATYEVDNKSIQQDLSRLLIKARREEHNEKEMYQKMLGQAKKLEQKNKQTPKQASTDSSKLKLLGYIMGSILIGVVGVAIYRYKY